MVSKNAYVIISAIILLLLFYLGFIHASNNTPRIAYVQNVETYNGNFLVTLRTNSVINYKRVSLTYDADYCITGFEGVVIGENITKQGVYVYKILIKTGVGDCAGSLFYKHINIWDINHSLVTITGCDASNTQIAGLTALAGVFVISTIKWLSL